MTAEKELLKLIDQYGEACRKHERAIIKETGFIAPAEQVYLIREKIKRKLGIEEETTPPYSLRKGI